KVRLFESKVALAVLSFVTLPSDTVHLYVRLPPQAEPVAALCNCAVVLSPRQLSSFGETVKLLMTGSVYSLMLNVTGPPVTLRFGSVASTTSTSTWKSPALFGVNVKSGLLEPCGCPFNFHA